MTPGPDAPRPLLLLFVDDDPWNLNFYSAFAEASGFEARCLENSLDALATAKEMQPDLIVLDVDMPLLDGFGVLRQLRAEPRTASVPVLFLTARVKDFQSRAKGMQMGALDYLVKPVDTTELKLRIEHHLTHRS